MNIRQNPNKEFTIKMLKKIKENDGFCPCRLVKNEDTKCMCKEFRDMEEGVCRCGLYIKEKFVEE